MKIWGSERTASFSVKTLNSCNFEVRIRQNCIYLIKDAFALMCVLRSLCKLLNNILINVRESVFAINFRAALHKEENSSISIIKAFNIFVIVQFIEFFLLQSCFYRSALADCWEGVVLSIFIDFQFSFLLASFSRMGNTFFQLNSIELLSLPRHSLFRRRRARRYALSTSPVCRCYCASYYFRNKKTRIQDDGGDMFRHYVAITIDAQGVRETHVCLYDNLHIWPPTEWFVDRSIHTGD